MLQQQQLHEEPNADTALPLVDQADLVMISGMRLLLSVTFRLPISFGCEIEAKLHIREPAHAAPHDSVSWW